MCEPSATHVCATHMWEQRANKAARVGSKAARFGSCFTSSACHALVPPRMAFEARGSAWMTASAAAMSSGLAMSPKAMVMVDESGSSFQTK